MNKSDVAPTRGRARARKPRQQQQSVSLDYFFVGRGSWVHRPVSCLQRREIIDGAPAAAQQQCHTGSSRRRRSPISGVCIAFDNSFFLNGAAGGGAGKGGHRADEAAARCSKMGNIVHFELQHSYAERRELSCARLSIEPVNMSMMLYVRT